MIASPSANGPNAEVGPNAPADGRPLLLHLVQRCVNYARLAGQVIRDVQAAREGANLTQHDDGGSASSLGALGASLK
jgi:hypothetical protein